MTSQISERHLLHFQRSLFMEHYNLLTWTWNAKGGPWKIMTSAEGGDDEQSQVFVICCAFCVPSRSFVVPCVHTYIHGSKLSNSKQVIYKRLVVVTRNYNFYLKSKVCSSRANGHKFINPSKYQTLWWKTYRYRIPKILTINIVKMTQNVQMYKCTGGSASIKRCRLTSIGIPMLKIRRSRGVMQYANNRIWMYKYNLPLPHVIHCTAPTRIKTPKG